MEGLQKQDKAALESIRRETFEWPPLHYIMSNIATSLATANPDIMRMYAAQVDDRSLRKKIFGKISAELERTRCMLEIIYDGSLNERRPNLHRTLILREEGLRTLHQQQIELLRQWRDLQKAGDANRAEDVLLQLLLNINAIASCLGTTG